MKIRHIDWYADEWLTGVAELTPEERGVYDTIINMIYSNGGSIRITPDWPHLFKCHGNKLKAILSRLEKREKIVRNGLEISQKRCRNELEKAQIRVGKALENGKKGGRPRKEINDLEKPDGFFPEKLTSTTNHQPPTEVTEESVTSETRARRASVARDFDEWWLRYPHKVAKDDARKAYTKARKIADQGALLDGVARYQLTKPPDHAWCNPATWLNRGRWQDEPALETIGFGNGQHKQTPGEKLWEGFARAAEAYGGADSSFAEPLLDGGRSPGDEAGPSRRLVGRPH